MLKGKMEFRLGSEQRVCGQGDVVVIPIELAFRRADINRYVLALDVAGFRETATKRAQMRRRGCLMWRPATRSRVLPTAARAPQAATRPRRQAT